MTIKTLEFLKLWLVARFVYIRTVRTYNLVVETDKVHSIRFIKKNLKVFN
jgi:hypothetical protein